MADPTMFEQLVGPVLYTALPGARRLLKENGPAALALLLEDIQAGRIRKEAVASSAYALSLAHVEAAMGPPSSPLSMLATSRDESLRAYQASRADLRPDIAPDEALHVINRDFIQAWVLLSFLRAGQQVYEVTPGLAAKLAATELRGVDADDLHLPFHAVSIQVPREAGIYTVGPYGRMPVAEFYVIEDEVEGVRAWRIHVASEGGIDSPAQDLTLLVLLPAGTSLDTCIEATDAMQAMAGGTFGYSIDSTTKAMTVAREATPEWASLFRWLMNVVIYATNSGAREEVWRNEEAAALREQMLAMPPGSKKERLKERIRTLDKRRRIILGPGVALEVLDGGRGAPLTVRVRVQGHWRRQPHGPGRKERKLIWIEPFWRGPEDGATPAAAPVHVLR